MTIRRIQWTLVMGLFATAMACVDVGMAPSLDAVMVTDAGQGDVSDGGADPEPCGEALAQRCNADGNIETCAAGQWVLGKACEEGTVCFDVPIYSQPTCMPHFDCYETIMHVISCEHGPLDFQARNACVGSCLDHAEPSDSGLLECYGNNCSAGAENPHECVTDNCAMPLQECLIPKEDECIPPDCPAPQVGPPDCSSVAECHGAANAKCLSGDACGGDESCMPECLLEEHAACRADASPESMVAYLALGACQVGHCASAPKDEKDACLWQNCPTESLQCLVGTNSTSEATCQQTFECMVTALKEQRGITGMKECLAEATLKGAEDALTFLACYLRSVADDGACAEWSGGDASDANLTSCLQTECGASLAACYTP